MAGKKKTDINRFLQEARKRGMNYAQAQYAETAEQVRVGPVPAGYQAAGEKRRTYNGKKKDGSTYAEFMG